MNIFSKCKPGVSVILCVSLAVPMVFLFVGCRKVEPDVSVNRAALQEENVQLKVDLAATQKEVETLKADVGRVQRENEELAGGHKTKNGWLIGVGVLAVIGFFAGVSMGLKAVRVSREAKKGDGDERKAIV